MFEFNGAENRRQLVSLIRMAVGRPCQYKQHDFATLKSAMQLIETRAKKVENVWTVKPERGIPAINVITHEKSVEIYIKQNESARNRILVNEVGGRIIISLESFTKSSKYNNAGYSNVTYFLDMDHMIAFFKSTFFAIDRISNERIDKYQNEMAFNGVNFVIKKVDGNNQSYGQGRLQPMRYLDANPTTPLTKDNYDRVINNMRETYLIVDSDVSINGEIDKIDSRLP